MAEVIKTYRQSLPALKLIGKRYTAPPDWGPWFEHSWFGEIERAMGGEAAAHALYEDGDAYVGLLYLDKDKQLTEYWLGELVPPETPLPDGFETMDLPGRQLGVGWVYGPESNMGDLVLSGNKVFRALIQAGMEPICQPDGSMWCMERYGCPRFTTPDDQRNIILDYCFFVK